MAKFNSFEEIKAWRKAYDEVSRMTLALSEYLLESTGKANAVTLER